MELREVELSVKRRVIGAALEQVHPGSTLHEVPQFNVTRMSLTSTRLTECILVKSGR